MGQDTHMASYTSSNSARTIIFIRKHPPQFGGLIFILRSKSPLFFGFHEKICVPRILVHCNGNIRIGGGAFKMAYLFQLLGVNRDGILIFSIILLIFVFKCMEYINLMILTSFASAFIFL